MSGRITPPSLGGWVDGKEESAAAVVVVIFLGGDAVVYCLKTCVCVVWLIVFLCCLWRLLIDTPRRVEHFLKATCSRFSEEILCGRAMPVVLKEVEMRTHEKAGG